MSRTTTLRYKAYDSTVRRATICLALGVLLTASVSACSETGANNCGSSSLRVESDAASRDLLSCAGAITSDPGLTRLTLRVGQIAHLGGDSAANLMFRSSTAFVTVHSQDLTAAAPGTADIFTEKGKYVPPSCSSGAAVCPLLIITVTP